MKRTALLIPATAVALFSYAQHERSVFSATGRAGVSTTFVTDYQSLGINPSNLGWKPKYEGRYVSLGFLEWAHSVHSEALTKPELRAALKDFLSGKESDKFSREEQKDAAKAFAGAGTSVNADLGSLAIAVNTNKLGGFAAGVRDRFQWYSKFNETTSDILFTGYNADYFNRKITAGGDTIDVNDPKYHPDSIVKAFSTLPLLFSQLMDGSRFSMSWTREFSFSYGKKLVAIKKAEGEGDRIAIYGGVGFKYLSGIAIMDVRAEDGNFEAYSAITPFLDINYGAAEAANPSTVKQNGLLPKSVGSGMGFDLGASLIVNDKLKFGLAVTDIGSMTWTGNVYEAHDTLLFDTESGGFESLNLFREAQNIFSDSGLFTWGGAVERTTKLPSVVRAGASYAFSENFEIGLDAVLPANDVSGNYENPVVAAGADFLLLPWLRLSAGVTLGGNYGVNIPMGAVVILGENGGWELGVASRDVVTYFLKNSPTLSLSAGFLRFKI